MYLVDFIYDGIKLSNLGCIVGYAATGANDSREMGSVINLETAINHGSYISEIVNANYPDVYTYTFDIIKGGCKHNENSFSDKEITWFMRWLNRKEYKKFIPIYNDNISFYKLFYKGTFTEVKAISMGGNVVGFTLTFVTNSPFGYLDINPNTFIIEQNGGTCQLFDDSEELGSVYPNSFEIKLTNAGDLTIHNSMDESTRITSIKNCVANETITLDCIHKVITSDQTHVGLYNDFNYTFPRISNNMIDRMNKFTSSLACTIKIDYNPIRKVGLI